MTERDLSKLLAAAREDVGTKEEVDALRNTLASTLWNGNGGPPSGGENSATPLAGNGVATAGAKGGAAFAVKASIATLVIASAAIWAISRNGHEASQTGTPGDIKPSGDRSPTMPLTPATSAATPLTSGGSSVPPPVSSSSRSEASGVRRVPAVPALAPTESALLGQAQAALSRNPTLALSLAEQHRAWYPRGMLAQEREVIAIEALKRAGHMAEASARASKFLKAYPSSAHRSKVESLVPPQGPKAIPLALPKE